MDTLEILIIDMAQASAHSSSGSGELEPLSEPFLPPVRRPSAFVFVNAVRSGLHVTFGLGAACKQVGMN